MNFVNNPFYTWDSCSLKVACVSCRTLETERCNHYTYLFISRHLVLSKQGHTSIESRLASYFLVCLTFIKGVDYTDCPSSSKPPRIPSLWMQEIASLMLWHNRLYPITYILIKCWLASSQVRHLGRAMRIGEFWEEESSVCSHYPEEIITLCWQR